MLKKFSILVLMACIAAACSNSPKTAETTTEEVIEPVMITVTDFTNKAGELVGQIVSMEGLVNHVCQHGGARLFLIDTATKETVKIVTAENMPSFNTDLEGQDIVVVGVVDELRIDEDYLTEWEHELTMSVEEVEEDDGSGHEGSLKGEKADQGDHVAGMEQIESYRKQIKESGSDHLSFYSVICQEYKVKEPEIQE